MEPIEPINPPSISMKVEKPATNPVFSLTSVTQKQMKKDEKKKSTIKIVPTQKKRKPEAEDKESTPKSLTVKIGSKIAVKDDKNSKDVILKKPKVEESSSSLLGLADYSDSD